MTKVIKKIKEILYNSYYILNRQNKPSAILKKTKYLKFNINDYKFWFDKNNLNASLLREKVKQGRKIKVAFLVNWCFCWTSESIMLEMMKNSLFEVSIIVAPVSFYEIDTALKIYKDNLAQIKQKYKDKVPVYEGYDFKNSQITDYTNMFDIIFVPSNDEGIEFNEYKIYNLLKNNVLPCYVCYAYYVAKDSAILSDTYNLCWKVFVENNLNLEDFKQRQAIKGKNAVVTGYPKTDAFYGLKKSEHKRKQIIIAPHHSINGYGLQGQFLKYSELFLELPKMYPQIDFIFRPHPLLYNALRQSQYWGEGETQKYYDKISSYDNCIYDTKSDYYQTFVDSDGIIHDCGSFLPEYLFTHNPPCYMLRDENAINEYFGPFGKGCLDNYYKAYNKDDIISYIDNVVLKEKDTMKTKREEFANKYVKYNFPNVAKHIAEYIEGVLTK